MVDSDSLRAWTEAYTRAWEGSDADAAAALFTADATYRSHILKPAYEGTQGIAEYWRRATASQSDVDVQFGQPLVDGDRVVVEWWTKMTDDGSDETVPGVLLLNFSGELCSALREYWHPADGRVEPYSRWGQLADGDRAGTEVAVKKWVDGYESAWRAQDAEAAADLYADGVAYRSHPFRKPELGRAGVLNYSIHAFAEEIDPDPLFGEPVVMGSSAAVEYWTPMIEEGREVTLAGCCILTFDANALVSESREYWFVDEGRQSPPPEWGWR